MTMTLIETITVGSGGAAFIEFTGIAGTGKDLLLKFSLRNSDTGAADSALLTFNGSTASFTNRILYGTGSSALSTSSSRDILGGITGNGATSNTFSNGELYISNYASAANKSWSADAVTENNATVVRTAITAGLWSNTAALTSILFAGGYNFVEHSSISLYSIS
jgi:hypothetical protein